MRENIFAVFSISTVTADDKQLVDLRDELLALPFDVFGFVLGIVLPLDIVVLQSLHGGLNEDGRNDVEDPEDDGEHAQ
eukprot:CAMPEP_0180651120 /NCGR_PEP_ID=MMETSP1037_2-20121125/52667_1 /TAXON_ID=632150 /ORGANISM="Azadinium spinosum, Strain 3D9" /LENGTH=77 /DNA_ID=CAMNT_0022676651 /DNA_START=231 /DNA_END=464 /DNA_ORIENTATION=+